MNMFIKALILFAFMAAYASAELVATYECPNTTTHSKDILMEVSECKSTDERCPLFQGKTHSVILKYTTLKNYTGQTHFRVYGVFEKFTVPYRGKTDAFENAAYTDNGEALKELGMMVAFRQIKHLSDFAVSANYPKISLRVRFVVIERKTKEIIMCCELPVEIKSPPGAEA